MGNTYSYAKVVCITITTSFLWYSNPILAQDSRVGVASFYHDKFNGRQTANGEIFDNNSYTCAHRTLPFGTKIEITNLENNKFVIATVNDRGPYNYNRIVDVTKHLAKELKFHSSGLAKVRLRVLNDHEQPLFTASSEFVQNDQQPFFCLKLGSFQNQKVIPELSKKMMDEYGLPVFIKKYEDASGEPYKVYAGTFFKKEDADYMLMYIQPKFPTATLAVYDQPTIR